jgi:hypothetical protein
MQDSLILSVSHACIQCVEFHDQDSFRKYAKLLLHIKIFIFNITGYIKSFKQCCIKCTSFYWNRDSSADWIRSPCWYGSRFLFSAMTVVIVSFTASFRMVVDSCSLPFPLTSRVNFCTVPWHRGNLLPLFIIINPENLASLFIYCLRTEAHKCIRSKAFI